MSVKMDKIGTITYKVGTTLQGKEEVAIGIQYVKNIEYLGLCRNSHLKILLEQFNKNFTKDFINTSPTTK